MDSTAASKTIPLQIRKLVIRDIKKGESHCKIGEKYGFCQAAVTNLWAKRRGRKRIADARIIREIQKKKTKSYTHGNQGSNSATNLGQ